MEAVKDKPRGRQAREARTAHSTGTVGSSSMNVNHETRGGSTRARVRRSLTQQHRRHKISREGEFIFIQTSEPKSVLLKFASS